MIASVHDRPFLTRFRADHSRATMRHAALKSAARWTTATLGWVGFLTVSASFMLALATWNYWTGNDDRVTMHFGSMDSIPEFVAMVVAGGFVLFAVPRWPRVALTIVHYAAIIGIGAILVGDPLPRRVAPDGTTVMIASELVTLLVLAGFSGVALWKSNAASGMFARDAVN